MTNILNSDTLLQVLDLGHNHSDCRLLGVFYFMNNIPQIFGSLVFNDSVMKKRLPPATYKELKQSMKSGTHLSSDVASIVASSLKDWAIEHGVTHYSHWFQPMTNITAEKHDSFISPAPGGSVIMEFSGKELIKGESDASSFPNGGIRATFEARGYTIWDTSSYAFIKGGTLYIPTAFCSYNGEALDKKTPLLRSMQAIDKQASRILKLFNHAKGTRVIPTVGAEQEYFLIDKDLYFKRADLVFSGRTLLGARPPKGQELEDHYFGAIKPRVAAFMSELDLELWKLGVNAKTKHNEAAPAQHELAPVFSTTNVATDHNQLIMELIKSIADKHGFAALLHEKPFAGVNGSGKHNNWALATESGVNLLDPGETPHENAQFLLFLTAVIKAVDDYQDLLRLSAASAGNDHRLGANEAPPAIISMFLGDELTEILESIDKGAVYCSKTKQQMEIGASVLPKFPKDTTDRNRTSPFAFTGNKFEFRMVGSAFSIAGPNIVLNTAVAEVLAQFADKLEKSKNLSKDLSQLVKDTFNAHKRIVFNDNNYSEQWVIEAKKRGLSNLRATPEAIKEFTSKKAIELFSRHGVFSASEINSRYEIIIETYVKTIRIEALTMLDIVRGSIFGAVIECQNALAKLIKTKKAAGSFSGALEEHLLGKASNLSASMLSKLEILEKTVLELENISGAQGQAEFCRDKIIPSMNTLRVVVDELEVHVGKKYWPLPSYSQMLFGVN